MARSTASMCGGTVDIPILDDTLLSQVSFSEKHADGYFHFLKYPGVYVDDSNEFIRPDNTTYSTAGGYNDQNLRVKLKWKITPDCNLPASRRLYQRRRPVDGQPAARAEAWAEGRVQHVHLHPRRCNLPQGH